LPMSGVAAVEVSRYDVPIQVYESRPPRSPTTVAMAVLTMVVSRADMARPASAPPRAIMIWRWVSPGGDAASACALMLARYNEVLIAAAP